MTKPHDIGYVGFVAGKGLIDRTIEFFDHGNYNHCFLTMPENTVLESQYLVNTHIVSNTYKESEVTYLSLNLTDEQKEKLIHASFSYLEDKYDIKQIFGILFHDLFDVSTNISWNDKKKMICSELVVSLLYDINYFSDNEYQSLKNATPNELFSYLHNRIVKAS